MNSKAIIYLFESLALVSVFAVPKEYRLVVYYLIHSIPSIICTIIAYMGVPRNKKDNSILILFFLLSFYLGTIGIILVLIISYLLLRIFKDRHNYSYEMVPMNVLLDTQAINSPKWEEGKVKKIIYKKTAKIDEKLLALKIITSSLETIPLVYRFLNEPDDSRLYAYSFINSLERVFQERITSLEQQVKEKEDPELLIKLAKTYYDYVGLGLVVSELRNFYIEKAMEMAEKAYHLLGNREDVISLMGKIYKYLNDNEKAFAFLYEVYSSSPNFENALELCEVLFKLERYTEIKKIFKELVQKVRYVRKFPIVRVWIDEGS